MSDYFEHLSGNTRVKGYLTRMVENNRISNSMLFAGPKGVSKVQFAEAFAKMLICSNDPKGSHRLKIEKGNHPDIRIYRPEGKIGMHSIDSMRLFSEEVYLSPYEALWKVFIIQDAERMLPSSANALLKTFEEPLKQSIIILVSSAPELLLTTVRSRCLKIYFEEEEGSVRRNPKEVLGPAHDAVLKLLANGRVATYKQLTEGVDEIVKYIEEAKKQTEEMARESFKGDLSNLSAVQKQSLEKEIEGMMSVKLAGEAHTIFDTILGWYRDLQLIYLNGNRSYLYHPNYETEGEQAVQRGLMLPIEYVLKAIASVRTSLERSTSLDICLENLFLQLNIL